MIRIFALASNATALLLLSIFTYRLWRNLRFLHNLRRTTGLSPVPPPVSVLIPARNEARSVAQCIESVVGQEYSNFEVIALDDQSTDETGIILDALSAQHENLIVLYSSENPPTGWNGKSYACHRLAERATGDWLLFTDADTLHTPTSIAQGVAHAEYLDVELLSVFPRQITESWSERVLISFILDFLPLVTIDLTALWRGGSSSIVANGQYLLVRASAYRAIGGHQAIAQALVDDFALAKHLRSKGYKVAFVDGTFMLSCRMYRGVREVWDGFSKNIMLALAVSSTEKRSLWWGAFFAWGYACLFVLPFLLLFSTFRKGSILVLGWLALLRGMANWYLTRPLMEVITTPLAAWSVMALGLNALLRRIRGTQIVWKGRDYNATS